MTQKLLRSKHTKEVWVVLRDAYLYNSWLGQHATHLTLALLDAASGAAVAGTEWTLTSTMEDEWNDLEPIRGVV